MRSRYERDEKQYCLSCVCLENKMYQNRSRPYCSKYNEFLQSWSDEAGRCDNCKFLGRPSAVDIAIPKLLECNSKILDQLTEIDKKLDKILNTRGYHGTAVRKRNGSSR